MNGSTSTSLTNYGVGTSSSDNGTVLSSDTTNAGSNPDTDGDGNPNEPTDNNPTPFSPAVDSVVVDFFIPQGFSPNGDGVNDVLIIKGIKAFPSNKMEIFNRWGNYVTKIEGYDNADKVWNGKASEGFRYGGDDLPEGTYFYILDLGNGEKPLKGYIYLNRSVK
jgi:gliding motility-associated-like protein